ncbi:MAG: metal ABC transporter substrate-binding protein [Dehalococcoidia bacterium]|nr:metal ABC transporter substrate-binding protein [Dehalococcoidia bacterium]
MMKPSIRNQALRLFALSLAAIALLASILLAACQEEEVKVGETARVKVAVSLAIFADFVREVGGDRVDVSTLIPAGADPHTYDPPPSRVARLTEADLVIVNGLGLEAALQDVIEENTPSSTPIIELSRGLSATNDQQSANPHLWLDVQNAIAYVERIRDALVEIDPPSAESYRANADSYLAELRTLDQEVATAIDSIPADRRKLVTFHDAFSYLAQRYGLQVVGVVVASPGKEPSAKDVADLVEAIAAEGVPAVFKEPEYNSRILELAADDAGVEVCTLYSHALDKKVDTYVKLMRFNAKELVRCLA